MNRLFEFRNWIDLFREDGFASIAGTILLVAAGLTLLLFSDRIARWRAERR